MSDIPKDAIPCLDKGFVRLVDHMGDDSAIVQMARVSYGEGTKTVSSDRTLIRYLLRNRHCYHPDMQVLTIKGWKNWSDCGNRETFIVPDPDNNKLKLENLAVKSFDCDEELYCFKNNRMSYKVTSGHTMYYCNTIWGQRKEKVFEKKKVEEIKKWGHFYPLSMFNIQTPEIPCPFGQLVGFYIGDGGQYSKNIISFHLKKDRKIKYILKILESLNMEYSVKENTKRGTKCIKVTRTPELNRIINLSGEEKSVNIDVQNSSKEFLFGVLDGMINSDGHIGKRKKISYSSTNLEFINLFETLMAFFGMDSHARGVGASTTMQTCHYGCNRVSLESRPKYHYREKYKGKVYCATTSTGLLLVRGSQDKYAFVCGNTSPFEGVQFKFHIKLPIFVSNQWVRHRTWSFNQMSGRYSEMPEDCYVPETDHITTQDPMNKQGGTNLVLSRANECRETFHDDQEYIKANYKWKLDQGMRRELARINLPLSQYTEMYASVDLHNLLHFLRLRMDSHAQYEIRVYAESLYKLIQPIVPVVCEAFEDYVLGGVYLTRAEVEKIEAIMSWYVGKDQRNNISQNLNSQEKDETIPNKREYREFLEKLRTLGIILSQNCRS